MIWLLQFIVGVGTLVGVCGVCHILGTLTIRAFEGNPKDEPAFAVVLTGFMAVTVGASLLGFCILIGRALLRLGGAA